MIQIKVVKLAEFMIDSPFNQTWSLLFSIRFQVWYRNHQLKYSKYRVWQTIWKRIYSAGLYLVTLLLFDTNDSSKNVPYTVIKRCCSTLALVPSWAYLLFERKHSDVGHSVNIPAQTLYIKFGLDGAKSKT